MFDQESWKKIKDFEQYEISNYGRVRNSQTKKVLKNNTSYGLYNMICLRHNGKMKLFAIHRLVAQAFIPNTNNKQEINHIDGNKRNNHVSNLEWCSRKENAIHSIKTGLQTKSQIDKAIKSMKKANSKPILQIKNGIIVERYESLREASRKNNFTHSNLCLAANGKTKQAYGFIWRYER